MQDYYNIKSTLYNLYMRPSSDIIRNISNNAIDMTVGYDIFNGIESTHIAVSIESPLTRLLLTNALSESMTVDNATTAISNLLSSLS